MHFTDLVRGRALDPVRVAFLTLGVDDPVRRGPCLAGAESFCRRRYTESTLLLTTAPSLKLAP